MIRIGRRGLIAAFGASMAVLGLRPESVDARNLASRGKAAVGRWLLDASLGQRDVTGFGPEAPTLLGADLVQQWRTGLRDELRADRRLTIALVRWDKAFVLQGLAREEGLHARIERLSPSVFSVTLAARA